MAPLIARQRRTECGRGDHYEPFLAPYLERPCLRSDTPAVSRAARMTLYRTPGRSLTRPPRTRTTECSWRLWPSPGMYVVTSIPFVSRTRATFRSAEFGFFGVTVKTRVQTPRFCGAPRSAGVLTFAFGAVRPFRTSWLTVGIGLEVVLHSWRGLAHTTKGGGAKPTPTQRGMVAKFDAARQTAAKCGFPPGRCPSPSIYVSGHARVPHLQTVIRRPLSGLRAAAPRVVRHRHVRSTRGRGLGLERGRHGSHHSPDDRSRPRAN